MEDECPYIINMRENGCATQTRNIAEIHSFWFAGGWFLTFFALVD